MKAFRTTYTLLSLVMVAILIVVALPVINTQAATNTITLTPVADATVNKSHPSTNYGKALNLNVDGSPVIRSYLRFNVPALNGATITGAMLRMYVTDDSSSGFTLSKVANNSWSETGITYNNAPAVGGAVTSVGSYTSGIWLQLNLTGAVTTSGLVSFVMNTTHDTTTATASRETGANAPQLILTLSTPTATSTTAAVTPPTATKAPTGAPTNAPTSAPTTAPTTAPTQSSYPSPVGVGGTWNIKFADDFNGASLDLNKWQPNWLGGSNTAITKPVNSYELSCYDPAQVTEVSGALKLTAVARSCKAINGVTYSYASGLVNTSPHFTFTYGYLEARVWLDGTTTIWNWPAFWADGTGAWPTTGEIDVMEGLGGVPAWHYHWGTASNPQQVGGYPNLSTKTGWHTFGSDWEPGSITFYYDGVNVGQVTTNVVGSPMFVILNLGVSSTISGPIQVPSDFLIDYVRVWQH